jgi:hypothetical protein
MRLWPLFVDHLRGNEFCGGFDEGGLLPQRQRQQVGSGQFPRGLDAHGLNGITEQRNGCLEDGPRRSDGERARRRGPDEWIVGRVVP